MALKRGWEALASNLRPSLCEVEQHLLSLDYLGLIDPAHETTLHQKHSQVLSMWNTVLYAFYEHSPPCPQSP